MATKAEEEAQKVNIDIAKTLRDSFAADKLKADENAALQKNILAMLESNFKVGVDGKKTTEKLSQEERVSLEKKLSELVTVQAPVLGVLKNMTAAQVESRKAEADSIKQREVEMAAYKQALDDQGKNAEDDNEYNREMMKLEKDKSRLAKKDKVGFFAEKKNEAKFRLKQLASFEGLKEGFKNMGKSTVDVAKNAGGSILDMIKKGALLALIPAILAFLDSKYWVMTKKIIVDDIVPALVSLYENLIKPIGEVIFNVLGKQFQNIKDFFAGFGEAIEMFKKGDILGGIKKLFGSFGTLVTKTIDNLITGVLNIFQKIFGMEETESVGGSISKFFSDMYNSVKTYFTVTLPDQFKKAVDAVKVFFVDLFSADGLFGFVTAAFDDIMVSIKAIFSGDFSFDNFKKLFGSIMDIVYAPINIAVNAIKKIFKFGDPNKPFRLSEFVFEAIDKVIGFFKNLLNIDFKKMVSSIIPEKLLSFFGFGSEKSKTTSGGNTKVEETEKKVPQSRYGSNDVDAIVDPELKAAASAVFKAQQKANENPDDRSAGEALGNAKKDFRILSSKKMRTMKNEDGSRMTMRERGDNSRRLRALNASAQAGKLTMDAPAVVPQQPASGVTPRPNNGPPGGASVIVAPTSNVDARQTNPTYAGVTNINNSDPTMNALVAIR